MQTLNTLGQSNDLSSTNSTQADVKTHLTKYMMDVISMDIQQIQQNPGPPPVEDNNQSFLLC